MIKVFRLSDLIKYFIKIIIPVIIIIICLNIFIKKGNSGQQKLNGKENTNTKVEDIKEKSLNSVDEKQESTKVKDSKKEDSKLSKLNEKYQSSKLKSKLLSLFKKKDNTTTDETKQIDNGNNKDENKQVDNGNTISTNANNEDSKEKEYSKNNKSNKEYYFCINSEIVNLKNVKDETKIDLSSLLKKIIQSEFGILNQSSNINKENSNTESGYNNGENNGSNFQKLIEYSLGLTPIKFSSDNKISETNNKNSQNNEKEFKRRK